MEQEWGSIKIASTDLPCKKLQSLFLLPFHHQVFQEVQKLKKQRKALKAAAAAAKKQRNQEVPEDPSQAYQT